MPYPLEVGGVDDYRMKVGSMLLTLVDPNRGFEVAYNRWYERDHFYAGCMIGPFLFAGSRWVATRALEGRALAERRRDDRVAARRRFVRRDLLGREGSSRRPLRRVGPAPGARALRRGPRVRRAHATPTPSCSTTSARSYRDADPVPIELALDHGYDGLVIVWFDARGGRDARALARRARAHRRCPSCSPVRRSRS